MLRKIKDNRTKVIIFASLIILFVILNIVGTVFESLKFFILIPIFAMSGIGLLSVLRRIFPIKNILTFLTTSVFIGIWGNSLIIFIFGSLGTTLGKGFFLFYIIFAILINSILFFKFFKNDEIESFIKNVKLGITDIIFFGLLFILFINLVNTCIEVYFPLWDSFTFWAVDANYIFKNSRFRDANFTLLTNNYLPLFSLQIDYVYMLYGRIVEQTASLLSVTYSIIGALLVYSYILDIKKNEIIKKSLLYLSAFGAIYSFYIIHFLIFSLYADLFTSVVVLFYVVILFKNSWLEKDYWKRFLIISLLSITLYLTKTHYLIFSFSLFLFYVFYDGHIIVNKIKSLRINLGEILATIFLIIFLLITLSYSVHVSDETQFFQGVVEQVDLSNGILRNFMDLLNELIFNLPLLSITTLILFTCAFVVKKGFHRKDLIRIIFILVISSIPVAVYTLGIYPLFDSSLLRYLSLIYFVIPFVFIKILKNPEIHSKWQQILIVFVLIISQALFVYKVFSDTKFDFSFTPHTGEYKDFSSADKSMINRYFTPIREFYLLSTKIEKMIPKDSSIFFVTIDPNKEILTDSFLPVMYLRYYLIEYNKVGSFGCLPENCPKLYASEEIDFLIVYYYQSYWESCNTILEKDKIYLIDLRKDDYNGQGCIANESNYIELFF